MSSDDALRISALEAAFAIASHQREYSEIGNLEQSVSILKFGAAVCSALDYRRGLSLIDEFGLEMFEATSGGQADLQRVLTALILRHRPVWALGVPKGRRWCKQLIDEDTLQCLSYAGLYSDPASKEVVAWWDRIASEFRFVDDANRTLTGRAGEQLTLHSERQRLIALGLVGLEPSWVALEDNTLGYDVESWDFDEGGEAVRIFIEVKAHSTSNARFFLTRNEWTKARDFRDAYRVHVWALPTESCRVLSTNDLAEHVPEDKGYGQWQELSVTLG